MEIERKYLIKELPENLDSYEHHTIKQGYISTCPVIRIRQKDEKMILTVKSKGLLAREEFELDLTKEEFDRLSKKVDGLVISKTRYILPFIDDLIIELDVFHDEFEGFILAEIEFPTEEASKKYDPPAFFGKEVTLDSHFHNSYLSQLTKESILAFRSYVSSVSLSDN